VGKNRAYLHMNYIEFWNSETISFLKSKEKIYVYGAGAWGSLVTKFCVLNEITVKAIIVSNADNNINEIYKIPVIVDGITDRETYIIVAIDGQAGNEMSTALQLKGWTNIIRVKNVPQEYEGYLYNKFLEKRWYEDEVKLSFWKNTKHILHLNDPRTFNEKIQWIKLFGYTDEMTRLADKYLVREWIKEKIGEEYLIPLLGVWTKPENIELDKLPMKFILKANHGSGYNYLVEDKSKCNYDYILSVANKWLEENFSFYNFELQYKNITPRILVEEVVCPPSGEGEKLVDYKFHCFDGKAEFVQIIQDRDLELHNATQAIYSIGGEPQSWCFDDYPRVIKSQNKTKVKEMAILAEKLSMGFSYVRVDLYDTNKGIKFGEMTFTPGNGLYKYENNFTMEMDEYIGEKIKIVKE